MDALIPWPTQDAGSPLLDPSRAGLNTCPVNRKIGGHAYGGLQRPHRGARHSQFTSIGQARELAFAPPRAAPAAKFAR